MNRARCISERLIRICLTEFIALCITASYFRVDSQSAMTLLIFNLLFAPLLFQLNGSTTRKIALLTLGSIIGLFWQFIFNYFVSTCFGDSFGVLYTIAYPLLNLMWVVPLWAFSLSILPELPKPPAGDNMQ